MLNFGGAIMGTLLMWLRYLKRLLPIRLSLCAAHQRAYEPRLLRGAVAHWTARRGGLLRAVGGGIWRRNHRGVPCLALLPTPLQDPA